MKRVKPGVADATKIKLTAEDAELASSEFNKAKILEIEGLWPTGSVRLLRHNRVFVIEGTLNKLCRKGLKPRHFFLFNDILVYGSILTKDRYTSQSVLPLADMSLEDLGNSGYAKFGIQINHKDKSFQIFCQTQAEKDTWLKSLVKYIEQNGNGRKATEEISARAVWVPDNKVTKCMVCNEREFSLLFRRHHCRSCGKVVCGPCSDYKAIVSSGKAERVCKKCHMDLATGSKPTISLGLGMHTNDARRASDTSDTSDSDGEGEPHPEAPASDEPELTNEQRLEMVALIKQGLSAEEAKRKVLEPKKAPPPRPAPPPTVTVTTADGADGAAPVAPARRKKKAHHEDGEEEHAHGEGEGQGEGEGAHMLGGSEAKTAAAVAAVEEELSPEEKAALERKKAREQRRTAREKAKEEDLEVAGTTE